MQNKGHGRALVIFLCLLLIGGGAGLMYKDLTRDYRHGIYRCEDGRMMEEPAVPDPAAAAMEAASTDRLQEAHPEIKQYMMLVPAAACIQSEYLPEGAQVRDQKADLAQIRAGFPGCVQWIDLVDLFLGHSGEKLYYATDTCLSGWGSRYAARAALDGMGMERPGGKDTCYLLSNSFQGNLTPDETLLYRFIQKKTERLEIYVPENEAAYYRVDKSTEAWYGSLYDTSALESARPYDVFFGGERPLTEIYTTAVNGETLLVVGDRTADSIVPMFVSSFEKIIFMHPSTCAKTVEDLVDQYQPTRVLYLYGANNFMRDRTLVRALGE